MCKEQFWEGRVNTEPAIWPLTEFTFQWRRDMITVTPE